MDRRHLTIVRSADAPGVSAAGDSDPPDALFDELLTVMTGDEDEAEPRGPSATQQGGVPIAWSSKPDPAARQV